MTLAGALLDEVVLMPRSFVEQACARCSVTGSKIWFNCNPESPQHWFYREWICQADRRRALYIHFTLEDNPSLSKKIIDRYKRMYSGDFYRRFILGQWVLPEGRVYDFFSEDMLCDAPESCCEYIVSCDYGTKNPSSFGLWGRCGQTWYRLREYYYDGRKTGRQKTDEEYVAALAELCGEAVPHRVIVDPSAASFIEALSRAGFRVEKAENDVLHTAHSLAAQKRTHPHLPRLRRHGARVLPVSLGRARRKGSAAEAERPRNGRYPLFCRRHFKTYAELGRCVGGKVGI